MQNNNINIEYDVFCYGFSVLLNYLVFLAILVPLSIFLNIFFEAIFFIIAYIPIRRYIGGFHFSKNSLCTFFSVFFSVLIPSLSKYCEIRNIMIVYISIIFVFIISRFIGTVDHPNKRLTIKEKKIYTRKSIIIEIIYIIIALILFNMGKFKQSSLIIYSLLFCVIGIVMGRLFSEK